MANGNNGLINGIRQLTPRTRGLNVGGAQAPLGYRLRGAEQAGYPAGGTWKAGDVVPDRAALLWQATAGGVPGTWQMVNAAPARGFRPPDITISQALWMGSASGPFATGGTTSAASNADTSTYAVGSQSYFVTTNGSGALAKISGSFSSPLNLSAECPVLWIRQDSLGSNLAGYPRVYIGDTGLANCYEWKVTSATGQPWNLDGEWMRVTLPFGAATIIGSPNRASLAALTIQVFDNSSGTTTFHFGAIATMPEPAAFPNGVVSLCFDDGLLSQVQTAAPLMDGYGYRGTAFLISQVAQGGGHAPYTSYMTVAQAQALEASNGWECGSHAYSAAVHNASYTSVTDSAALADAAAAKAWMTAEGFRSPWLHAYPLGNFDAGTVLNSRQLFGAARTISQSGGFPDETFPPAQLMRLRSIAVSANTALATIEGYVAAAQANKEWLILTFHDIEASASGNLQFSTANFTSLLAYISAQGIPVLPVGDVLTAGISMEPVAALGDTVYGNAAGVPARLAGNAAATKNFFTQTGTGSASAAPAWSTVASGDLPAATTSAQGAVILDGTASDIQNTGPQAAGNSTKAAAANHVHFASGMYLCAPASYAPGSPVNNSTTSATLAAVSSANINTGSFVAPASGSVLVTASFEVTETTVGTNISFGLAAHGTVTPVVGNVMTMDAAAAMKGLLTLPFLVTGLVAGNSYSLDLLFAVAGAATLTITALGSTSTTPTGTVGAPVTMTVQAV